MTFLPGNLLFAVLCINFVGVNKNILSLSIISFFYHNLGHILS